MNGISKTSDGTAEPNSAARVISGGGAGHAPGLPTQKTAETAVSRASENHARFITLEGGEGAGKSTVLAALRERLAARGLDVVVTREPGGTPFSEAARALMLDPAYRGICAESELLLAFAARAQHVRELIVPALAAGRWVLSDRYTDASYAYQGGGRGQPLERIAALEAWFAPVQPDLTLLLDLPVAQGLARAGARGAADRIEAEGAEFFERVRSAYRERAARQSARFRIVDASQPVDIVRAAAIAHIDAFLDTVGVAA